MADFSLRNEVAAVVAASGDARKIRRWVLRNKCARSLDFSSFSLYCDVTSEDLQVEGAFDSSDVPLRWATEPRPERMTRISVFFDRQLPPGTEYSITVTYRHPRYFTLLPGLGVWLLKEWFAHVGEFKDIDATRQEPESWLYRVRILDPRRKWLLIRDPRYQVHVDCWPQSQVQFTEDGWELCWAFNIRPGDVRDDFWAGYSITRRFTTWQATVGFVLAAASLAGNVAALVAVARMLT